MFWFFDSNCACQAIVGSVAPPSTGLATSIDVVIPVHDGWAFTRRCLEHLREQTLSHAVVVCDNGSSDGTPGHVREAFPNVQVVEDSDEEREGFAKRIAEAIQ